MFKLFFNLNTANLEIQSSKLNLWSELYDFC